MHFEFIKYLNCGKILFASYTKPSALDDTCLSPSFTADVGGQLGLFCGASMITIIEVLEYIFTNFFWMCLFLLLKAPEIPRWNNPSHDQPTHVEKNKGIQEC